jgi:pseudoazurin
MTGKLGQYVHEALSEVAVRVCLPEFKGSAVRVCTVAFAAFVMLLAASPAAGKEWRVAMVNHGANGTMDFTPAFLRIAPGDTVRFVAQDKSHNAESVPELTPAGGTLFKGQLNQDVVVKFARPGLYGYKCQPHYAMGMVGLVEVGKPLNMAPFKAALAKLPPFARVRMTKFVQQAK